MCSPHPIYVIHHNIRPPSKRLPLLNPSANYGVRITIVTYRSTQVYKTVSSLKLHPIQGYFQLFPSMSPPYYLCILQTYSEAMSAEHILPLFLNAVQTQAVLTSLQEQGIEDVDI